MAILSNSSSTSPLQFLRRTTPPPPPFLLSFSLLQVRRRRSSPLNSSERHTEVDGEKAREALRKLDQQIQSLSQTDDVPKKRIIPNPPTITEQELERELITRGVRGEMPEISDSYLAYTAIALVLLTIFNNFIFQSFVKPSVDGYEKVTKIERIPLTEPE
ncbi:hypothetical protein LUZ60_005456 [Juncus effusus]|nr:hypothetical protein LUZ60_005456 [Juncus effusus]